MLILWSIAIPIIFGLGMGLITFTRDSYYDTNERKKFNSIVVGVISFILIAGEEFLVTLSYKSYGFNFYECYGTVGLLAAQSISLVIFLFVYLTYVDEDEVVGVTIFLFLIEIIVGFIICMGIRHLNVKYELEKMDYYEVGTETIYLEALNGSVTTEGSVHGGLFYISGHIGSTYEIYYATRKDNGALEISKVNYNKNVFDIFEDDIETPRIEVITHERKIFSPKGKELRSDSYKSYIIYIPVGTYTGDYVGFN